MDTREDRIHRRAYEIWEAAGRTGDPEDHWYAAEREFADRADDPAKADPAEVSSPVAEMAALGAALPGAEQDRGEVQRRQRQKVGS
jgi:Protein of unknown function (DUF2934)